MITPSVVGLVSATNMIDSWRAVQSIMSETVIKTPVIMHCSSGIISRLDNSNGLFATLFARELTRLQRLLQNIAARLIFAVGRRTDAAVNLLDT